MSDVKWIKIYTNMFDNRKIKQIETLPEGDAILVIWLKLLTLAGNVNDSGLVYFTKDIPYTDQMLSAQFNKPLSTIQLALSVFIKYNMIEITDDILHISNWEEYQNIDGMEKIKEQTRLRVQKHRDKQKLIDCNATCNVTVTQCNAIDIDIEEDIKNKNIDINNIPSSKPKKHKYGEYQNVLLTDEEYNKLHQDYPNASELITYLDEYIEMKGYKAKSHNLAIRKWVVDAVTRENKKKTQAQEKVTSNPFVEILMENHVFKEPAYDDSDNVNAIDEELEALKKMRGIK